VCSRHTTWRRPRRRNTQQHTPFPVYAAAGRGHRRPRPAGTVGRSARHPAGDRTPPSRGRPPPCGHFARPGAVPRQRFPGHRGRHDGNVRPCAITGLPAPLRLPGRQKADDQSHGLRPSRCRPCGVIRWAGRAAVPSKQSLQGRPEPTPGCPGISFCCPLPAVPRRDPPTGRPAARTASRPAGSPRAGDLRAPRGRERRRRSAFSGRRSPR